MTIVSTDILKQCDIRGTYPRPLGAPQAEQIGLAVGTQIKSEPHRNIKVVVGCDVRSSGDTLKKAMISGLRHTGLKIVDAGVVSTPLLGFATRFSGASVGVMVTASHNPPEYNGFKFFLKGLPASVEWIQKVYDVLNKENFRKGAGIVEKKNFYPDYRNSVVNSVGQNFQGFHLVIDPGNGMTALTAPKIFESVNCDLTMINGEMDGDFPGRGADSSSPAALEALGDKVRKAKAQMGAAFDGDGDRVSFVDEKGREVPNDVILSLFSIQLLAKYKGGRVIYDGKCSDWVDKTVRAHGGVPLLERSGHTFIFTRMTQERALLAGEASGHFFLPGLFPSDALYVCLKLMELLKESNQTLSQLCQPFPPLVSSHDVKLKLSPEQVSALFESLKSRAKEMGGVVSTLDGVRAVFPDGWGIARMSVTEPVLSCRFEASTAKRMIALVAEWTQDQPEIREMIVEKMTQK